MSLVPESYIINYALASNLDKCRLWPWAVTVLWWPLFPLCENKGPHRVVPHRHVETLSCARLLVHKKKERIVACTSHGNNFWNSLTVKSNGFALLAHWRWGQVSCVVVCVVSLQYKDLKTPRLCLMADYREVIRAHVSGCTHSLLVLTQKVMHYNSYITHIRTFTQQTAVYVPRIQITSLFHPKPQHWSLVLLDTSGWIHGKQQITFCEIYKPLHEDALHWATHLNRRCRF